MLPPLGGLSGTHALDHLVAQAALEQAVASVAVLTPFSLSRVAALSSVMACPQ